MKILYIFSNFHLANTTGQGGLVMQLIKKTKQTSYRVSVISNNQLRSDRFIKNDINYYLIKGLGNFKTYLINIFQVISFIKQIKPHSISVNGILMTVYVWFINKLFHKPLFSLVTETIDHVHPFYRKLFYLASRDCQQIFVTAQFLRKQLMKIGVEKNKIKIVRIGLDEQYLKPRNIKENIDVLYFGDSNHNRGFDLVVKLAEKLNKLKFLISIRYQDKDCQNEVALAKKLANVNLMFYPYKESLQSIIARSKLVILPYRWMLIRPPISLLEPLALGKCVITSSLAGNREIVKNNYNGLIVDFNNLNKIAETLSLLVKNKKIRNRLEEAARKTMQAMYQTKEYSKIIDYYALEKPSK